MILFGEVAHEGDMDGTLDVVANGGRQEGFNLGELLRVLVGG